MAPWLPLVAPGSRYSYSNVRAVLTDDRVRQAVTRVSENDFVRGRDSQASRAVSAEAIRRAQFVTGAIPAVPTHQSLRSADGPVHLASSAVKTSNTDRFSPCVKHRRPLNPSTTVQPKYNE